MDQDELLRRVVETLEQLELKYLVTGAIAMILYGEPRFTNDIDLVVQLPLNRLDDLVRAFPSDEFYLDPERARQAIDNKRQFNIIHPSSGLKIDIIIPAMDEFDQSRFSRAHRVRPAEDYEATFATAEDVIVRKLQFYSEGGSDKHLRDIAGVLRISPSDVVYFPPVLFFSRGLWRDEEVRCVRKDPVGFGAAYGAGARVSISDDGPARCEEARQKAGPGA
jgi:hypothetical protein